MEKNTKISIIICIIILIVLIGIICYNLFGNKEENKIENTIYNQTNKNTDNEDGNEIDENGIQENIIKEDVNDINKNTQNNATVEVEPQVIGREEQESMNQTQGQTDEEKVITLAKNKWGANDTSVTFVIENHDGDIYNVSVRSNDTTVAVAWYSVNIATGEVTQ